MKPFKIDQIDHIHVYVPNREEAAEWYNRVLGMAIVKEHEDWAEDTNGPLTISSDGGNTSIALFARPKAGSHHSTIAYRVSGQAFLDFLANLGELELKDINQRIVTAADVVDHDSSFSIYFCDPYDNPIELTTYDYEIVESATRP